MTKFGISWASFVVCHKSQQTSFVLWRVNSRAGVRTKKKERIGIDGPVCINRATRITVENFVPFLTFGMAATALSTDSAENIASPGCRREGIAAGLHYSWSKEFHETCKRRLVGSPTPQGRARRFGHEIQENQGVEDSRRNEHVGILRSIATGSSNTI